MENISNALSDDFLFNYESMRFKLFADLNKFINNVNSRVNRLSVYNIERSYNTNRLISNKIKHIQGINTNPSSAFIKNIERI